MRHEEIASLRAGSPAWRLLRADNAPLILSFLGRVFVDENVRDIAVSRLASELDDELFALNEQLGEDGYPKSARAYLDDWSAPETGWLRKYYPQGSDEPHYDATPAVEKAVAWVRGLRDRSFVGTESRLNTIFELLRQLVFGLQTDSQARLDELERRRRELDAEIAAVTSGDFSVLDTASARDRFQQFADTARGLLADFREVEANFRRLDRDLRERIATWGGAKGELLDDVVGGRSHISDSDQGRSFQAFYDLLLAPRRQQELVELLDRVQQLGLLDGENARLRFIHHDWLDAGERAQATVRQLSEQLRRFLDDQVWLENRRVMELLRSIEATALALRDRRTADFAHEIDASAPAVRLPMERPLYRKAHNAAVDSGDVREGRFETDAAALFEQTYVDPAPLIRSVRQALQRSAQVGLRDVIAGNPITQGLAELVTYMSLGDETFTTVFDDEARDTVDWTDDGGVTRVATLPRIIYSRNGFSGE
ncbi:DUF3375 domain-containing protein [Mycobacterium lacus]|uniref:Uncharacterized protein n=1 Tax=Mycobacterium lacus TaxID=169765 RepID=A0A1X1YID7_9MYCO|nr:DUF3375 domain-containing protein [Mycobacterium lacus]MCV7125491.1 DUF3375 domain-containing protein [Mycobacterium lacus]ORW10814.1 hypothetical protein AWC15_16740 [Mycobacterium lacus]BBX98159.1 hypothetical protein MLAC_34530 [Mycobacterium lacus]